MMPKRSFKKPEPTAAELEIEQLKTQIAEQRGLSRDLTTVLEKRNAEIARLQIDVARLKQENSELASDLRLHLGYAQRDRARIEALRAALTAMLAREQEHARLRGFADCCCMGLSRSAEQEYETGCCPHQLGQAALGGEQSPADVLLELANVRRDKR